MSEQITDTLNTILQTQADKFEDAIKTGKLSLEDLRKWFLAYIPTLVEINPLGLYDNPLSRLIIRHIGGGIPGDFLLEFIKIEFTKSYKQALSNFNQKYDSMEIKSPTDFEDLRRHCSAFQTRVRVLRQAALLRQVEPILWDMVMKDADKNLENVRRLLGKVIEDPDYIEYADATFEIYAASTRTINGLNPPKKGEELNSDVMEEFNNPLIARLYQQYYQFWRQVQKDPEYNEAETAVMIKMDEYISRTSPEYQQDNSSTYSPIADCHYNATLLLEEFFVTTCPDVFEQHQTWFERRLATYDTALSDAQRNYKGNSYTVNELFNMTCGENGTTPEEVLRKRTQKTTSKAKEDAMQYVKVAEIRV